VDSHPRNGKSRLGLVFPLPIAITTPPMNPMVSEWLQRLLILQDRDSRCGAIQRQLEDIPVEISREEESVVHLKTAHAELKEELKGLERKQLDLEGEVELTEEHIVKYKTQQLQVKKNEEYKALEHEIEAQQNKISELEDEELQLLDVMDQKQSKLDASGESLIEQKRILETHIKRLKKNFASFSSELEAAQNAVKECEVGLEPGVLKQYWYVKTQIKRPPIIVPVEDGRCKGCFLKVSGDVATESRRGTELVRCDNCSRILYFDR
jgi:predicted  nucleic acid-binding Zn-ribbon protein